MSALKVTNTSEFLEQNFREIQQSHSKCLYDGQLQVLFVGGARTDWLVPPSVKEKMLYEAQGGCVIKFLKGGTSQQLTLKQGTLTLLPAGAHFTVTRKADSIACLTKPRKSSVMTKPSEDFAIPIPIDMQKYIDAHKEQIDKAPHQLFGPPANNSEVALYGKGSYKFTADSANNDSVLIVMVI